MDTSEAPAPMLLDKDGVFVLVDTETFGLDPVDDPPLEIGFMIVDLDMTVLHQRDWVIYDGEYYDLREQELAKASRAGDPGAKIVYEMHLASGLWDDMADKGQDIDEVSAEVLEWFAEIGLPQGCHLLGSSVHFDKNILWFNFRALHDYFHYRIVDVSSLKVIVEKYMPAVDKAAKALKPVKAHRALSDLEDTRQEFLFYLNNVIGDE